MNVDLMIDVGPKRGDEKGRIVVKLVKAGDEAEEVSVNKFLLWY